MHSRSSRGIARRPQNPSPQKPSDDVFIKPDPNAPIVEESGVSLRTPSLRYPPQEISNSLRYSTASYPRRSTSMSPHKGNRNNSPRSQIDNTGISLIDTRRHRSRSVSPRRRGHRGGYRGGLHAGDRGRRERAQADNTGSPITPRQRDSWPQSGVHLGQQGFVPTINPPRTTAEILAVYDIFLDDIVNRLKENEERLRRQNAQSPDHDHWKETTFPIKVESDWEDIPDVAVSNIVTPRSQRRVHFDLDHGDAVSAAVPVSQEFHVENPVEYRSREDRVESEGVREKTATEIISMLPPYNSLTRSNDEKREDVVQVTEIAFSEPQVHEITTQNALSSAPAPVTFGNSHSHEFRAASGPSTFCSPTCSIPHTKNILQPLVTQEGRKRSVEMEHYPSTVTSPTSISPLRASFGNMFIDAARGVSEGESSSMQADFPSPPCSPPKRTKGSTDLLRRGEVSHLRTKVRLIERR